MLAPAGVESQVPWGDRMDKLAATTGRTDEEAS